MGANKPLVAGNWKMNGLAASLGELKALKERLAQNPISEADVMVCPPATLLAQARYFLTGSTILLGAQDCHTEPCGAYTGDLSAEMLADAGASAVIVGHSERRSDHGESDSLVDAKARAAQRAGMTAIICVGETEKERRDGATLQIVRRQLEGSVPNAARASNTVIAYEPVWAIGTGKVASVEQAREAHQVVRATLDRVVAPGVGQSVAVLYGGSVSDKNAVALGTAIVTAGGVAALIAKLPFVAACGGVLLLGTVLADGAYAALRTPKSCSIFNAAGVEIADEIPYEELLTKDERDEEARAPTGAMDASFETAAVAKRARVRFGEIFLDRLPDESPPT